MANKILSLENISVVFDGFKALTDVNINVMENTIHFFIGPNGAGKTTLLDIICGKTKPTNGKVKYFPDGKEITLTGMKEYLIVGLGIGRKFQVPSVFTNLTVYENMELSLKNGKGVISSIFSKPTEEEKERIDEIFDMVDLLDKKEYKGINLAHGEKQWLEIAMLLVQKPKVILLDEPVAGMGKPETNFSDAQLIEHLNGNIHYQLFCGVQIDPLHPLTNPKIVSAIRQELAHRLDVEPLQLILAEHWKPYLENLHVCMTDATCYESHLRFPTDTKLLWEGIVWLHRHLCKHCQTLHIQRPRNKYLDVRRAYLAYSKLRKRRKSQTRMITRRLLQLLENSILPTDNPNDRLS